MIWLRPEGVTFDGVVLANVSSVSVDRASARLVEEWADGGPHVVFADAARRRVTIRVVRAVTEAEVLAPDVGELGALSFTPSTNASSGGRVTVTAGQAVVTSVTHSVSRGGGSTQTIEFVALSSDGAKDPVVQVEK